MAKYYYDKYNVNRVTRYRESSWKYEEELLYPPDYQVSTSYGFDSINNEYYHRGSHVFLNTDSRGNYYGIPPSGSWIRRYNVGDYGFTKVYIKLASDSTTYTETTRGSFVETIIAEDGTYPSNGVKGDYWYVKLGLAFPEFNMRINGALNTSENGWVKIDSQLREIDSIYTKIDGVLKEV